MAEYPRLHLNQIAEVAAGNPAPQLSTDFIADGLPFVRMQDVGRYHHTNNLLVTTDKISTDAVKRHRLRLFPAGSVLIPKSGASVNLNHRAMLGIDAYIVSHLAVLIPNRKHVMPEFLYWWSLAYDPRHQAQTTSLPSLPLSLIKMAEISLPPIAEQRRLVDVLSRANGILQLRGDAEKKSAELIPALFVDMFGDHVRNLKAWPVKLLGDFCSIVGGSSLPQGVPFLGQDYGLMLLKVGDMNLFGNEVNIVKSKEWVPEQLKTYSKIAADTIIFPKRGAAIATNKKRITTRPALIDPNLMGVKPNVSEVLTSYLFQWFSAFNLSDISSGTTVMQLNKVDLKPLKVPIPPLKLQQEFEKKRAAILDIQSQQAIAAVKAQDTFDALLAQVFSAN